MQFEPVLYQNKFHDVILMQKQHGIQRVEIPIHINEFLLTFQVFTEFHFLQREILFNMVLVQITDMLDALCITQAL